LNRLNARLQKNPSEEMLITFREGIHIVYCREIQLKILEEDKGDLETGRCMAVAQVHFQTGR
jgi:hypothetical protein